MDTNKLIKLKEINYKILKTCAWCTSVTLSNSKNGPAGWATCQKYKYLHLKHNTMRETSVHVSGVCPQWKPNVQLIQQTFGHGVLLERH